MHFIHPIDEDAKLAKKLLFIFCGIFIIGIEILSIIGSIAYVIRHINDLTEILYVSFQITSLISSISTFAIGITYRCYFVKIIGTIQAVYDSSKKLRLDFTIYPPQ